MNRDAAALIAREIVDKAGRENPAPLFRPATVTAGGPTGTLLAEGDVAPVPYSAVCEPPQEGDRVLVLFDPPHGCYVVDYETPPRDIFCASWGIGGVTVNAGASQGQTFGNAPAYDPAGMDDGTSTLKTIQRTGRYVIIFRARAEVGGAVNYVLVFVNGVEEFGASDTSPVFGFSRLSCADRGTFVEGDTIEFRCSSTVTGAWEKLRASVQWEGPALDDDTYA